MIGNNCFIGNRVILLYGVTIPNNTIVAAGSVVTNSIKEPGYLLGGNPAKGLEKYTISWKNPQIILCVFTD